MEEELAKSNKGLYYNQGKWINDHEYGKGRYCNEQCGDDLHLVTADESPLLFREHSRRKK